MKKGIIILTIGFAFILSSYFYINQRILKNDQGFLICPLGWYCSNDGKLEIRNTSSDQQQNAIRITLTQDGPNNGFIDAKAYLDDEYKKYKLWEKNQCDSAKFKNHTTVCMPVTPGWTQNYIKHESNPFFHYVSTIQVDPIDLPETNQITSEYVVLTRKNAYTIRILNPQNYNINMVNLYASLIFPM